MNKLFNFTQAKGKRHKFLSFNLGGGAKLYKNFAQKLLAVSLCMAMVLLGVPRGQNFVAEAADEATKSVALLTLTLTGDEEEPLTAKMEWKSFVQGTTVGLEVIFVDEDGTAWGPLDYGSWLDTYGSMKPSDDGFKTFAPAAWLGALPSGFMFGVPALFGAAWDPDDSLPLLRLYLGARDWFAPLPLGLRGDTFAESPGVARLAVGSSLALLSHPYLALFPSGAPEGSVFDVTLSADGLDASVASFDSASALLAGVAAGSTACALSFAGVITVPEQPPEVLPPQALGTLAVEVYDPSVPVTGVSLGDTAKTLAEGESFDLTATIFPENASNKNVTWSSSDETVATVSGDGLTAKVTALKAGTTTITVTTEDGDHTATCEVTVTEAGGTPPPPSGPGAPVDRSSWGTPYVREADGVTQYVDSSGKTSVELSGANAFGSGMGGIVWLREESHGTSAWYGLYVLSRDDLWNVGYRFYVGWLRPADDDYTTYYSQLDDAQKARVEDDNGWIFLTGVEDSDGNKVQPAHPVSVYVQIGDDWDLDQLKAYFISAAADSPVAVEDVHDFPYPEGTDEFGMLTLSHFSPYFIFDELTDEEKAALTPEHSGPKTNVTTGDDLATQITVTGLGMTLVLALGIMLRLITNKRKFDE